MRLMRHGAIAEYTPGKTLVVADALSRSPVKNQESSVLEDDVELHVRMV